MKFYLPALIFLLGSSAGKAQLVGGLSVALENDHDNIGIGLTGEKFLGNALALNFSYIIHFNKKFSLFFPASQSQFDFKFKLWHAGIGLSLYPVRSNTVELYGFWAAALTKAGNEDTFTKLTTGQTSTMKKSSTTFGVDVGAGINFLTLKRKLKPFLESKINFGAERFFISAGLKYVIKSHGPNE